MMSAGARQIRDSALRRLLLAKRWILAVSLALTGALAGLAANAFPGKTITTSASGATSGQGAAGSSSSTEGSPSSLTPAEQPPQAAEQSEQGSSTEPESQAAVEAPVVSGGS